MAASGKKDEAVKKNRQMTLALFPQQDRISKIILEYIQSTHSYSSEIPITVATFIGAASTGNLNKRWSTDPRPNIPLEPMKRKMTVLEADQWQIDDSD